MAIIQEAFEIQDEIMKKLISGEFQKFGGVVRLAVGQKKKGPVEKLLNPVKLEAKRQAINLGGKAVKALKTNKKVRLAAGVAAGACIAYGAWSHRRAKPAASFKKLLKSYLAEIRQGTLDIETIDGTLEALDNVEKKTDIEKIQVSLSTGEVAVLVKQVHDYTMKLAEINNVDLTHDEKSLEYGSIVDLRKYLMIQKRIFETTELITQE